MDSEDNQAKLLKYLVSVEKLGNEIVADRRQIVLMDQKRNSNREAIRALKNETQSKCYITVGSVLVKNNVTNALALLEADQKQLNIDINIIQSNLKVKVNDLRDLEMQPPVPGLTLIPVSGCDKFTLGLY